MKLSTLVLIVVAVLTGIYAISPWNVAIPLACIIIWIIKSLSGSGGAGSGSDWTDFGGGGDSGGGGGD